MVAIAPRDGDSDIPTPCPLVQNHHFGTKHSSAEDLAVIPAAAANF